MKTAGREIDRPVCGAWKCKTWKWQTRSDAGCAIEWQ